MKRETCLEAGQKLDALGKQAIPSLVRHLGDWRPLAIQSFSVRAEKGNFEGLSHYAPEVVADLLTTVLNRKVGSGLGFKETGRGSSNLHRRNMVEGWRVWLGCALQLPR